MGDLLIVVGLSREARIAAPYGRVTVGAASIGAPRPGTRGLISFGVCGALDPTLAAGDLIVADGVLAGGERLASDPGWANALRAALPGAGRGDVAAGDAIVGSPEAKAALRAASGAAIVDMESHAVARAARAAGLAFAVVRAVSDTAASALPFAAQAGFRPNGEPDVAAVIAALGRRPWELAALIRTGLDAGKAFRSLERAARALTLLPVQLRPG